MCNELNLDLVNINAHAKFFQFHQCILKIVSPNKVLGQNEGIMGNLKTVYPILCMWGRGINNEYLVAFYALTHKKKLH